MSNGKQIEFLLAGIQTDLGEPLAGGLVYSYLAGTDTPTSIYEDADLTRPYSNPAVLDAKGCLTAFTGESLKLVIKRPTGESFAVYDNLSYGSLTSSSAIIGSIAILSELTVEPNSTVNMGGNRIRNVGAPVLNTDAATKEYVDNSFLSPRTGNFHLGGYHITNLADPINPQDAVTKAYVDSRDDATKSSIYNDAWQGSVLNMGNKKISNLLDAVLPSDAVTYGQVQSMLSIQATGRKLSPVNMQTMQIDPGKTIYIRGVGAGGGGGITVPSSFAASKSGGGYGGIGAYWEGSLTNSSSDTITIQFTIPAGGYGASGIVTRDNTTISSYTKASPGAGVAKIRLISPQVQDLVMLPQGNPGSTPYAAGLTPLCTESYQGYLYYETNTLVSGTLSPLISYSSPYVNIITYTESPSQHARPGFIVYGYDEYEGGARYAPAQFPATLSPPSTPFGSSFAVLIDYVPTVAPYTRIAAWSGYFISFSTPSSYTAPKGSGGAPCITAAPISGSGSYLIYAAKGGDACFIVEY